MRRASQTNRRQFLQAAGASAAALLAAPRAGSVLAAEQAAFTVGIYTRPWSALDYRAAFDAIAEAGFKHAGLMTITLPGRTLVIQQDTPLEEAARMMVDNHISGLPVMRGNTLVGMITESDLFKVFLELLGARAWGLRVTIKIQEGRGVLARLTQQLAERGANIVALGTFWGDDPTNREIAFKVQGIERKELEQILAALDAELLDMRET